METQELLNVISKALNDKEHIDELVFSIHKELGKWDSAGRYYLKDEFKTNSSLSIREPSRHWPRSIYSHIFTTKYLNELVVLLSNK